MTNEQTVFLGALDGAPKFFRRFFERGVSLGAMMAVVNHDDSLDQMADWIKRGRPVITYIDGQPVADLSTALPEAGDPTQGMLTVTKQSLAEVIKAGQYDWSNPDITEDRFAIGDDQLGEWEFKIFDFGRDTSSRNARRLMKKAGFDPAKSGHLLAYGALHSEEQRKRPIVGLGSVVHVDGSRHVLILDENGGSRRLYLGWYDNDWLASFLFLGVRRRSAP